MRALLVIGALALSGCATETFTNRLACTVAGDLAYHVSMYGPIGISSKIDAKDSKVVCVAPVPKK